VAGVGITGRDTTVPYTVGFANGDAQYWAAASAGTGYFSRTGMLPGTYTCTVYKGELAVHTGSVTVTAGGTTTLNTIEVTADPSDSAAIWRIGDWNGAPTGFKNAALMTYAHPSDTRSVAWTGSYTVGTSATSAFPAYQWRDVNDGMLVDFTLTAAQAATAHTLNIGISTAFLNGRPRATVNSWVSSIPTAVSEPSTRSLTVGSYRGNNHSYSWTVPASALKAGANTLRIDVVSGSTGTGYLSPGFAYDCVELLA
jgi:rhamnogalacturonan endolyase